VVGRRVPAKVSSRLVKIRNSSGTESGGETSTTKSVDMAQNVAQKTHRAVKDTTAMVFFQAMALDRICPSFGRAATLLNRELRPVPCLESNGG